MKKFRMLWICSLIFAISSFCDHAVQAKHEVESGSSWKTVQAADLSLLSPSDFSDEELDLPFYLKHFHALANSVIEDGPLRGFIDIHLWRSRRENVPINARIMENVIALAFFYATDRPWNPYCGSEDIRIRLEAALDYLNTLQTPSGLFPSWNPKYQQGGMATTAFITKFIGESLVILKQHRAVIDSSVLERTVNAQRKAILTLLENDEMYNRGKRFSNQYTNVWAGALAFLSIYPDTGIRLMLEKRIRQSAKDFQSPLGYFYENHGTDFGYNFVTHHSNLWMAYHYCRNTDLSGYFVEEERKFGEWIIYNAVPEPDDRTFTLNRAIEMRQMKTVIDEDTYFRQTPLSEKVASARVFQFTDVELKNERSQKRKDLEHSWPEVGKLDTGSFSAYSPYVFLHRNHYRWHPGPLQKAKSLCQLPYMKESRFFHQKMDARNPVIFTYVRQPAYYAAFNSGPLLSQRQRYGIGLLWHPECGSFLQSQTNASTAAWGTCPEGQEKVHEADTINAIFRIDDHSIYPEIGAIDYNGDVLEVIYPMKQYGKKTLRFKDDEIEVIVIHEGLFQENLPLLLRDNDELDASQDGKITLKKSRQCIELNYSGPAKVSIDHTGRNSGDQKVVVVRLSARNKLIYRIIPVNGSGPPTQKCRNR